MTAVMLHITSASPLGVWEADISARGAGLHGLRVGSHEVMPRDGESARTKWSSGHTLAPWPNRLRDGVWTFQGNVLSAPVNDGLGNALHGLVMHRDFAIVEQSEDSIALECELGDDAVYPFAVTIRVEYRLAADGLSSIMSARNGSTDRVPVAVATHPYFPFDDDTTITINAAHAFEVDERLIPTGRLVDLSQWNAETGVPLPVQTFAVDDCFTALRRDDAGRAHTVLHYADGWQTDVWQTSSLPHTVIFTTHEFTWAERGDRRAIAIEPQSAPTNAFNSGLDLVWLEPGADCAVQWGIAARAPEGAE